jgi:Xaa-Pro aminopeptidase
MRIAPPDVLASRATRLRASLTASDLQALVITSLPNVAYLTGFFGSNAIVVMTADTLSIVTDSRYAEPLAARADAWPHLRPTVTAAGVSSETALVDILEPLKGGRIGFESPHMTVSRHRAVARMLTTRGWTDELLETEGLVEAMRVRKDPWEIDRLRDGGSRLSSVAKCILSRALAGRTESDVAAEIELELRRVGFERPAFDTIVAAGPNAALPHGRAGSRQIAEGDLVVLDFGGMLDGYCTDLSRTVVAGRSGDREQELIERVIEAQHAAFEAVKAGVGPEEVDAAARDRLARHGLAEAFTHGTGHGLGLEIHEAPRVTRARAGHPEPPLAAGTVMTLEPGVYFPGWGGVRIEDDVLVTEAGAEWLTDVPRTL